MRARAASAGLAAAAVAASLVVSVSCASKWTMRTAPAPISLQWPFQPNAAKVTYVHALTGFAPRARAGAAFKAAVFGREREDRNGFVLPVAVTMGGDGRIAVADIGRRCVHLFIPGREAYLRLDGSKREKLLSPVAVAFDDRLQLWVSDSVGKLFTFAEDGTFLRTRGAAGDEPFARPTGLVFSPTAGLLFVVDTLAHKVHALTPDGVPAFSFGRRGEEPGGFNFPTHIFRSPAGELFITDSLNFRVAVFDERGRSLGTFGKHGDGSGDLAIPKGLAVDRDGVVYVVDSLFDNVQLFSRGGDFLLTIGKRGTDVGEFWLPSGIYISEAGDLYVCDTYNKRIQVFRITERYVEPTS